MKIHGLRMCVLLGAGLCCVPALQGCGALGAAAYVVAGHGSVPAEYEFPKDEPVVVLVENFKSEDATQIFSDQMGLLVTDDLKANKVGPLIEQLEVQKLRVADTAAFKKMRIQEIGRAVGAKSILYIHLEGAEVGAAGGTGAIGGTASARVRVVDAATGQTRWPADEAEGRPISAALRERPIGDRPDPKSVRVEVLKLLATRIGRQFYEWERENSRDGEKMR